jgi:hypothetical protein
VLDGGVRIFILGSGKDRERRPRTEVSVLDVTSWLSLRPDDVMALFS